MRVLLNTKPSLLYNKTGVGYYVYNLYKELLKFNIDVTPTINNASNNFIGSLSRISCQLRGFMGKYYPDSLVRYLGDSLIKGTSCNDGGISNFEIYHETSVDHIPDFTIPSVMNVYDMALFACPQFFTKGFLNYAKANVSSNIMIAERIIVNTQFIQDEIMSLFQIQDKKIDVIPLAPSPFFRQLDNPRIKTERLKQIGEKDFILYVGTVEPRKNLKILLKAYSLIKAKYDISLVMAGVLRDDYKHEIATCLDDFGIKENVVLSGYVSEETLLSLYNKAAVFVYPSLYEGFGLPPLEAMACGVPVIISDIPPLREVAGDAASAFSPKDFEELANLICKILESESLRSEMVERGIRRAREYSWEKTAALTIQTYKKALDN